MALKDLLDLSQSQGQKKIGLSEERVRQIIPAARQYIAFWREYPDLFVDFMKGPESTFHLFFYQRVFMRAAMRHKYVYAVFPRAYENAPIRKYSYFRGQTSLIKRTPFFNFKQR